MYDCWVCEVDHEYTTVFDFRSCSREIIDISSFERKLTLPFSLTPLNKARSFIQTLHHYYFAWGLYWHFRFDDFDCSGSQLCQEYKRHIFCFGFLTVLCSFNIAWLLHTLKRLYTVWFVWLWYVCKGNNQHVFDLSSVWACWKLFNINLGFTQTP